MCNPVVARPGDVEVTHVDDRIERQLLIEAPPSEVWDVITTSGWLADDVEFELFPGGEASFGSDAETRSGWVEEVAPPTPEPGSAGRLVFWWSVSAEPASRVELTLEPEGHATRVRVVETRPLEVLDLTGIPLPRQGGSIHGPAMLSLA
jgi:uncharacterized protein YndB with AHSA1/START domain